MAHRKMKFQKAKAQANSDFTRTFPAKADSQGNRAKPNHAKGAGKRAKAKR